MNRKIAQLFQPSFQLYFFCLILFALMSALFYLPLAGIELAIVACLGIYNRENNRRRRREITKYIESVTGTVDTATKDMCGQVIYPAALINTTTNQEAAQAFLDYLKTDEAAQVFEAVGFTMVK